MVNCSDDEYCDYIADYLNAWLPADRPGRRALYSDYKIFGLASNPSRPHIKIWLHAWRRCGIIRDPLNPVPRSRALPAFTARAEKLVTMFSRSTNLNVITALDRRHTDEHSRPLILIGFRRDMRDDDVELCAKLARVIIYGMERRISDFEPHNAMTTSGLLGITNLLDGREYRMAESPRR